MKRRFNRNQPLTFSYRLKFAKKTRHQVKSFLSPEGWGNDILSRFQEMAFKNEMSTFAHFPEWQGLLSKISNVLENCTNYAMEEIGKSYVGYQPYLLFTFAHNDYLALARCAAAGHCLPAYPVGRASVEFAMYGWYLSTVPDASERWEKKPIKPTDKKDDQEWKKQRNKWSQEFSFSLIAKKLREKEKGLSILAEYLHQIAIDFGGHPNRSAVFLNTKLKNKLFTNSYLHPWNDFSKNTMKFAVEVGMFLISLFAMSFKDANGSMDLNEAVEMFANELNSLQEGPIT